MTTIQLGGIGMQVGEMQGVFDQREVDLDALLMKTSRRGERRPGVEFIEISIEHVFDTTTLRSRWAIRSASFAQPAMRGDGAQAERGSGVGGGRGGWRGRRRTNEFAAELPGLLNDPEAVALQFGPQGLDRQVTAVRDVPGAAESDRIGDLGWLWGPDDAGPRVIVVIVAVDAAGFIHRGADQIPAIRWEPTVHARQDVAAVDLCNYGLEENIVEVVVGIRPLADVLHGESDLQAARLGELAGYRDGVRHKVNSVDLEAALSKEAGGRACAAAVLKYPPAVGLLAGRQRAIQEITGLEVLVSACIACVQVVP